MLEPIFSIKTEEQSDTYGKFIYDPLHQSFGHSIGNALRRTLLSSLQGVAITHVRVAGADHIFSTLEGVKESVLDIVLNLKKVRFNSNGKGPFSVRISTSGEGKVYAKDIQGEAEVVNGDLYIAQVTDKKAKLDIDMIVNIGYGYEPSEEKQNQTGYIAIDSTFSPVTKVNFKVEEARVGRKTNFDRLILEVWTDGSLSPHDALENASMLLSRHFSGIAEGRGFKEETEQEESEEEVTKKPKAYDTIIDELNLPSRVINALLRENIETVADLVERGRDELSNLKGVGKKSLDLIDVELEKMEVELK